MMFILRIARSCFSIIAGRTISVAASLCAAALIISGTGVATAGGELRTGGAVVPLPLDYPELLQRWEVPSDVRSQGLAADNQGNVIVASRHKVRKYSRSGLFLSEWTLPDPDTAHIAGIEIARGENVVVLDVGNGRVLTFSWEEGLLNWWPLPESGHYQADLAVDAEGDVYVATRGQIRVYSAEGAHLREWPVSFPIGVDVDREGNVWVCESHVALQFSSEGQLLRAWSPKANGHHVSYPSGVAGISVDDSGIVYLLMVGFGPLAFTPPGLCLLALDWPGLYNPCCVTVDPDGRILVVDLDGSFSWVAEFAALPRGLALTSRLPENSVLPDRSISIDGSVYEPPVYLSSPAGTSHTIAVNPLEEPEPGHRIEFTGWSDGEAAPSREIIMPAAVPALEASFTELHCLTLSCDSGGTLSQDSGCYPVGSTAVIEAIPDEGFQFGFWSGPVDSSSACCQSPALNCCNPFWSVQNPISVSLSAPRTLHASFYRGDFELSISASDTDPYVNAAEPAGGYRPLYLWATTAEPGLSAIEADVAGSLEVLAFSPLNDVLNLAGSGNLLCAVGGCPSGEEANFLLGFWMVFDNGGDLCLQPSAANGILGAVDCGQSELRLWGTRVRGFASSGTPCVIYGDERGFTRRGALEEFPTPPVSQPAPGATAVEDPRPNPFVRSAALTFTLAAPEIATVSIYDVTGRLVRVLAREQLPAGAHTVMWDGRDGTGLRVAGGAYFLRFQAGNVARTRKVVYLGSR